MKWKCMLVDDEPPAIKVLQSHISHVDGLEVVATCNNALQALSVLSEKEVDVIFLDIKMPRIIGTRFLKNLYHPPKVIFVTAYREYAVEGFELDAVDYLLKPVSFERFLKAVSRLKRAMGEEVAAPTEEFKPNPEAFVYLKVDRNMQKVLLDQIVYIESWRDYSKVFLAGGKNLLVKQSITSLENLLSEHKFLRVHRSFIISLNKLTGYNHMNVQLENREVPIGRLYKAQVLETISKGNYQRE